MMALRPERMHGIDRRKCILARRAGAAGKPIELELVRRGDIGHAQRMLAHEFRNARPHVDVAPDIADHRIAAIARVRVRGLHLRDRIEDRGAGLGRAHVTGEYAVASAEHATLGYPAHQFADHRGFEYAPGPGAVTGVIGELHGVDRPHLDADPLQRKRRGGVADMAVGDVRLDREDVHAGHKNKRGGSMVPPRSNFQPFFVIGRSSRRISRKVETGFPIRICAND